MKQPDDMVTKEPFIRHLNAPPTDEWDIRFGVTALGAFMTHIISTAPGEVRRVFTLLAPALAWLYPGPGEAKAFREIERLRGALGDIAAVTEYQRTIALERGEVDTEDLLRVLNTRAAGALGLRSDHQESDVVQP